MLLFFLSVVCFVFVVVSEGVGVGFFFNELKFVLLFKKYFNTDYLYFITFFI